MAALLFNSVPVTAYGAEAGEAGVYSEAELPEITEGGEETAPGEMPGEEAESPETPENEEAPEGEETAPARLKNLPRRSR